MTETTYWTLAELVAVLKRHLAVELIGPPQLQISGLSTLAAAGPDDLTFLSHPRYLKQLLASRAACVVVSAPMRDAAIERGSCLVVDDAYHCFALITQLWKRRTRSELVVGIHPTAYIHGEAVVANDASIGAFCCVDAGAVIEAGAELGAHCVVGAGARIGAGTRLAARVTVGERCQIGKRGILHSGVVIGADGFGFAPHDGQWVKIEQLGAVRIGDDVEIGANSCVDRGALLDTLIEDGVKLDNLVQIGHNVRIGKHTAIAGCAGVAGSATIGAHCTIGGGAIVLGHLQLADHVHVSAASIVTRSLLKRGHYTGLFPIDDNAAWEKNAATLKQLHTLRDRLKQIEKAIASRL